MRPSSRCTWSRSWRSCCSTFDRCESEGTTRRALCAECGRCVLEDAERRTVAEEEPYVVSERERGRARESLVCVSSQALVDTIFFFFFFLVRRCHGNSRAHVTDCLFLRSDIDCLSMDSYGFAWLLLGHLSMWRVRYGLQLLKSNKTAAAIHVQVGTSLVERSALARPFLAPLSALHIVFGNGRSTRHPLLISERYCVLHSHLRFFVCVLRTQRLVATPPLLRHYRRPC